MIFTRSQASSFLRSHLGPRLEAIRAILGRPRFKKCFKKGSKINQIDKKSFLNCPKIIFSWGSSFWILLGGAFAIVAFFRNNVQAYAYYPGLKQSFFGKFETLNRLAFAISALVIRSGFWNIWFVMKVPDVLKAAQSGIHWQFETNTKMQWFSPNLSKYAMIFTKFEQSQTEKIKYFDRFTLTFYLILDL